MADSDAGEGLVQMHCVELLTVCVKTRNMEAPVEKIDHAGTADADRPGA